MMLASGQVCYGCSKAGASPLWCSQLESAQIRPIRQRTTRATTLAGRQLLSPTCHTAVAAKHEYFLVSRILLPTRVPAFATLLKAAIGAAKAKATTRLSIQRSASRGPWE